MEEDRVSSSSSEEDRGQSSGSSPGETSAAWLSRRPVPALHSLLCSRARRCC
jgi:hypothetical protein